MEIFEGRTYGRIYFDSDNNILSYEGETTKEGFAFRDDDAVGDEICYIPELVFCEDDNKSTITKEKADEYGYTFNELMELVKTRLGFEVNEKTIETIARDVLSRLECGLPEFYLYK